MRYHHPPTLSPFLVPAASARLNDGRAVTVSFPVEDLKDSSYGFRWVVGTMRITCLIS